MTSFLNVPFRFETPQDHGYLAEHKKLSSFLYELVSDVEFGRFAKLQGVEDWRPLAAQACNEYARALLLESDTNPLKSDAKRQVMANFQRFVGDPAKAAFSRAIAI